MRNWRLIALIALLAVIFLQVPRALAAPIPPCTDGNCTVGAPEPGTFLLLGSGLAGLAGIAWRRSRRK